MNERQEPGSGQQQTAIKSSASWGKRITRFLLVVLLLVVAVVGTLVYLAKSEPSYWKEHEKFLAQVPAGKLEQIAREAEDKLSQLANLGVETTRPEPVDVMSELTRPGVEIQASVPSGMDQQKEAENLEETPKAPPVKPEDVPIDTTQTITLDNEEMAAIVQVRLDEWMQERGYVKPEEIQNPMVTVDDGELIMAFKLDAGKLSAVISGKFDVNIMDNGMAEITLRRFLVGRLPVPAETIGEYLREKSGGDYRAEQVGEWLAKLQRIEIKPVIELEHRRRARIIDYQILKSGLELTVRVQDHKTYKQMNEALSGVPVD